MIHQFANQKIGYSLNGEAKGLMAPKLILVWEGVGRNRKKEVEKQKETGKK